jgi:hypothetical protein
MKARLEKQRRVQDDHGVTVKIAKNKDLEHGHKKWMGCDVGRPAIATPA